jgi:hypothetical protein
VQVTSQLLAPDILSQIRKNTLDAPAFMLLEGAGAGVAGVAMQLDSTDGIPLYHYGEPLLRRKALPLASSACLGALARAMCKSLRLCECACE